jgi:competence protein ComEC
MAADARLRSNAAAGALEAVDLRVPAPSWLAVAAWAAAVVSLARGRLRAGALWSAAAALALVGGSGPRADGLLEVAALDVGQGDAIVLRSPGGRVMVVDAGRSRGAADAGERVVAPFLWSLGARRIDALVVTHAHPDHSGGVPFLVRQFAVGSVWEGVAPRRDPGYDALDRALRGTAATRLGIGHGQRRVWDGVEVEVLGPRPTPERPLRTRNDDSLVIRARLGEVAFLLTGDVEQAGEAALPEAPSFALKVPHHGSRSSSGARLLDRVAPRIALVSVGAANPFGHPHPEVLRRYAERGIRLFRTDRDGTVRILTDGRRVWARVFDAGEEVRLR